MPDDRQIALARAQAYSETLTRHVLALIETVEQRGAPNGPTLIAACEGMLRAAFQAGEEAANKFVRKLPNARCDAAVTSAQADHLRH